MLTRIHLLWFSAMAFCFLTGLSSVPSSVEPTSASRPAPSELELKIILGENPIDVGGLISARIVVTNYGETTAESLRLLVTTAPALLPIGGRGVTAVHILDDEIVVDPLAGLGPNERAEWFLIMGAERAGEAAVSATINVGSSERTLLAHTTVIVAGSTPVIAVDQAESLFEQAQRLVEIGDYTGAIDKLKVAVTLFDNQMFKASVYYLASIALQRLGRIDEARQQQQITRVLLSHSHTPASRWIPEIVHMTDVRDAETQNDETETRLVARRIAASAITGRVYTGSENTPIAGAVVSLDGAGGVAAMTDEQGYFVLWGMPQDFYTITVSKPGYQMRTRGNIDVRDNTTLRVDFRLISDITDPRLDVADVGVDEAGRLVGRVVAAIDQAPVGEASVFLEGPQRVLINTDRYGRYSVNGIAPGSYTATWSKPGFFRVTRFYINVVAGQTTTLETELSAETATASKK